MCVVIKIGKIVLVIGASVICGPYWGMAAQVAITGCEIWKNYKKGDWMMLVFDALGGAITVASLRVSAVAFNTAKTAAKEATIKAARDTVKQVCKEAGKKATKEIGKQAAKEIATNNLKGATKEATVRAAQETSKRVIQKNNSKSGQRSGTETRQGISSRTSFKRRPTYFQRGTKNGIKRGC